ncbi:MAG: alpha-amylase [Gammaproteobacteria bacterium]|nr:alpha-amylase [Gammaproteobacteria bacterium]|tara:strand:+ start:43056 stop:44813 length:1758 start_codon:yes stop_codon:yes gene_type:complete
MTVDLAEDLHNRVLAHLSQIYPDLEVEDLGQKLLQLMDLHQSPQKPRWLKNNWTEKDIALITYANTFVNKDEAPLLTLDYFLTRYFSEKISWVHVLPFFPFSSDDGFAVIDYTQVNDSFGTWEHIDQIARKFKLMSDLVINHCSSLGQWFTQFKQGKPPGKDYFFTVDRDFDTSQVVRPRATPLLREVQTQEGLKYVWCTFSHDQIDLNFRNPQVLLEMVKIIKLYLDNGVQIFRLDAVAFLWKEEGTSCLNLDQTHEIIRLIRTLIEYYKPGTIIITETNIPNRENLSYFGNANEAHIIYNFSLPPLLLNTMVTGNCHALKSWMMSMPPAQKGTTFLNFIASHDGIGLRPLEGLVEEEQIQRLIGAMELAGGAVSWRSLGSNGKQRPYEINISLFDAMKGTMDNPDDGNQEQRFICAHTVMLAMEGVPAFYIHSLLGTENDLEKLANTNNRRAINRHNWQLDEIEALLKEDNHHSRIMNELKRLIAIRKKQAAFHPNAIMFTLHVGDEVFAFWRQSLLRDQSIFCLNNISDTEQEVSLSNLNLVSTDQWSDLISGEKLRQDQEIIKLAPYQSVWLSNKAFQAYL